MRSVLGGTAAWRISIWTTVALAAGTAATFSIVYILVARGIRARSDAWLSGEAEVLAQVAADTPRDHLYNRVVGEVAELASRELPDERNARGQQLNSVFFLEEDPKDDGIPLWVGPSSDNAFLKAIHSNELAFGVPQSLTVDGWPTTFRVVVRHANGQTIYLGLSNRGIMHTLHTLTGRFLLMWAATVLVGFLISYTSARRTLLRVERITETVGRIGTNDLGERLPEPASSDEISRLAKTFNRMLARIQSSVTELRMVTDAVAHDLKSPVTSIRGTLESALSDESNERWRDSICEAIEGLDRLLNLLNTTLDVAEAQAGALSLDRSTVDFSAVVRQLADLYLPSMAERRHELEVDIKDQVTVEADVHLLQRVVSNLLENELAHLPPGCQIAIRLRSNNGSAELVVEDNGSGFPSDVVGRAFERFVKGKQSRGHGLGLAFVDAVVRAHGGTATIANNPAAGAAVTLSLPGNVSHVAQIDESAGRILTG
jgi:signal transduction histidine kinase